MPRLLLLTPLAAALLLPVPARAQFNNMCVTNVGPCQVNPAPIGSPCGCFTPFGPTPGQISAPALASPFGGQPRFSGVCRTFQGVCAVQPSPVGSPCGCFGVQGAVVP